MASYLHRCGVRCDVRLGDCPSLHLALPRGSAVAPSWRKALWTPRWSDVLGFSLGYFVDKLA